MFKIIHGIVDLYTLYLYVIVYIDVDVDVDVYSPSRNCRVWFEACMTRCQVRFSISEFFQSVYEVASKCLRKT